MLGTSNMINGKRNELGIRKDLKSIKGLAKTGGESNMADWVGVNIQQHKVPTEEYQGKGFDFPLIS